MPKNDIPPTPAVGEATPTPAPAASKAKPLQRTPVEELAAQLATPDWLFAAAKVKFGWPVGRELTPAEYADAIEATANEPIGAVAPVEPVNEEKADA